MEFSADERERAGLQVLARYLTISYDKPSATREGLYSLVAIDLAAELNRATAELEHYRSESAEQARIIGMGAEREAAPRAELERLKAREAEARALIEPNPFFIVTLDRRLDWMKRQKAWLARGTEPCS